MFFNPIHVGFHKRSAHRKSCLRAIPNGVLKRLARLTSKDSQLVSDQKIELIYPEHIKALKNTKLLPTPEFPEIPMIKQLWSEDIRDKKETEEKVKRNNSYKNSSKNKLIDRRNVHFVLSFSKFWSTLPEPMYKTINKTIKTNNLPWLRIRMTYRRFKNLGGTPTCRPFR